jgi:hypothetical protein
MQANSCTNGSLEDRTGLPDRANRPSPEPATAYYYDIFPKMRLLLRKMASNPVFEVAAIVEIIVPKDHPGMK